jgi:hypothetical protein
MKTHTRALRATLAAAIVLYFGAVLIYSTAHAQTGIEVRIGELERRAAAVDSEHLGERMARVEAVLDTNNKLLLSVLAAIVVMLLERVHQFGKRRETSSE